MVVLDVNGSSFDNFLLFCLLEFDFGILFLFIQIDSLTGLGVTKVECGSQFSVALTKSGAVYTWYVILLIVLLVFPTVMY